MNTTDPHFSLHPISRPELVAFPSPKVMLRELKLDEASLDARDVELIESYARAAVRAIEQNYLKILTQQWEIQFDRFPFRRNSLHLPIRPIQSVDGVTYFDEHGVEQEFTPDQYIADIFSLTPRIQPVSSAAWPSGPWPFTDWSIGAVRVRVTAGFGNIVDTGSVPERLSAALADVQQAVILIVRSWWINRGIGGQFGMQSETIGDYSYTREKNQDDNPEGIPKAALWLLEPYRYIAT